jgi:hypothetical protein
LSEGAAGRQKNQGKFLCHLSLEKKGGAKSSSRFSCLPAGRDAEIALG